MRCSTACAATLLGLAGLSGFIPPLAGQATGEPAGQEVWLGDDLAVTYRARIEGDWLVVEALHEPGWHTYAMDNMTRAADATGKTDPETELPTRITPSADLELQGPWRQTEPIDLSDPEILWYTWGFEERSFFAARVERAEAGAWVAVDAQACTDKLCAMVEDLRVPVVTSGTRSIDPATLVAVGGADDAPGEATGVREQLAEFGDWFQRALDIECSGQVPAARLVRIMTPGVDRPRQLNWVMALDVDEDGLLEPGEVGLGLWKNLDYQVERRMVGDVDGDSLLSPREYSLFVPDPGAATNADGVSELQDELFSDLDGNGDRRVSRDEITRSFGKSYTSRHWAHMVVFHLGRADTDGDGSLDRDELARAIVSAGGAVAPEDLAGWFEELSVAMGVLSKASVRLSEALTLRLTELGSSADGREGLEGPLRPLLSPACSSR